VWIDDESILGNPAGQSDIRTASMQLEAGQHAIRILFQKVNDDPPSIYLSWAPPDSPTTVVPVSALYPPPPTVLGPTE
jgi:hypothetical protein